MAGTRIARLPGLLFLLLAAGCAGTDRAPADPLLGAPLPPAPARAASLPPASSPVPSQAALTAPIATASTAALAQSSAQPLDATHDLRIGDARQAADNRSWQVQPTGAMLQAPAPPIARQDMPMPGAPLSPAGSAATYEQALAQLTSRGVTWYVLENTGDRGLCKFSCSIPNVQNPSISRKYEASAPDYLSAMRAVLDQISKER